MVRKAVHRRGWFSIVILCAMLAAGAANTAGAEDPTPTLEQLCTSQVRIVDLTHPLNSQNAYWPGENYTPFELRTLATLKRDGVLSKAFSMPEHLGTHIDAPNHFGAGQISVDQIPPQDLFSPGIVIDVSPMVMRDPDYRLTVDNIARWEKAQGRIPQKSVVLLRTGWGRHFKEVPRYQNRDVMGVMHFPGFSAEAARWLVAQRDIRGVGIDTMSIDHGPSRDFAVHHVLNEAGRYGLENVANLQELPPRGFYLVVAPIKIETGSGGPTRIFALLP